MKRRKLVALVMAAAMMSSMTGGIQASADGDVIELDFWTTGESNEDNDYYVMTQEFNELYEGKIKVNHIGIGGNDDQQQKFQLAAGSNTLPDMMILNAGSFVNDYVEAGVLSDMEDYLGGEEFTGRFTEETLKTASFGTYDEEHFWYFPVEAEFSGWYYNKALFDQCGLEIPETWTDFLNCIEVFRENDILPIAQSGVDDWAMWGYYAFYHRDGITAETYEKLLSGEIKAADCYELRRPLERIAELAEAGAYAENITTIDNSTAWSTFIGGEAAMYACGSWKIGALNELENCEDFVFSYGPEFEDGKLEKACGMRPYSWVFAFGSCLDKDEAKKEAAATFADWFCAPETNTKYFQELGRLSAATCDTSGDLTYIQQLAVDTIAEDVIGINNPATLCVDNSIGTVQDVGALALITQNATVDQVLQDIQDWVDRNAM